MGIVSATHEKGGHMKLKVSEDLVEKIGDEMARQRISRYALANLVAGEVGGNPINADRRMKRMFDRGNVDLDFALAICRQLDLEVSAERRK